MQTLGELGAHHAARTPEKVALTMGDTRWTYRDLDLRANRLAQALLEMGLAPGDRLALLAENGLDYATVTQAAARVGAIFLPLNFRLGAAELAFILGNAAPALVVAEEGYVPVLARALKEVPAHPRLLSMDGPGPADMPALIAAATDAAPGVAVDPQAPAMMMYTSGTTGFPKGVLYSHAHYLKLYEGLVEDGDFGAEDVVHLALPMFHNAGLNGALNTTLFAGGSVVIHRGPFDPAVILDQIERHRITFGLWVPTNLAIILDHPDYARHDLSSMKKIFYGGSTIEAGLRERAEAAFDCDFYQVYGSTECGNITILRPEDHRRLTRDVTGRPFSNVRTRVLRDDGTDCAEGEIGEVVVSAATGGMIGYWQNDAATAETIRDGWIHSGDLARVLPDGFLHVVDRKKDMIVSGAENIYPAEVEAVLMRHPDVAEVAVFGIPDRKYGETVCAAVVARPGAALEAGTLDAFCLDNLARYKRPRKWDFHETLPRNAAGKVTKGPLRQPYRDAASADAEPVEDQA